MFLPIGVSWQVPYDAQGISAILGIAVVGGYLAMRKPPKSRGRSGADRIDFGR